MPVLLLACAGAHTYSDSLDFEMVMYVALRTNRARSAIDVWCVGEDRVQFMRNFRTPFGIHGFNAS